MKEINDRFRFDKIFRRLLKTGFTHNEALQYITNRFTLSALVVQERIENKAYSDISSSDLISSDLLELKNDILNKLYDNPALLQLVIDRTFDGYTSEIQTIYGQLEKALR